MAVVKKPTTPRKKRDPVVKLGVVKCSNCQLRQAELSPPGRHCTECRLELAEITRLAYNLWKKSRGLPVETKDEEIARVMSEK